jgi:IS30 family transposase
LGTTDKEYKDEKITRPEEVEFFSEVGHCILMGINHKKGQEKFVFSLTQRGSRMSHPTD